MIDKVFRQSYWLALQSVRTMKRSETFFRGSKCGKERSSEEANRYRFCTIPLVDLEEEIIDKDFTQSYWLALQFWVQPNRIFTVGVPQASHGIS